MLRRGFATRYSVPSTEIDCPIDTRRASPAAVVVGSDVPVGSVDGDESAAEEGVSLTDSLRQPDGNAMPVPSRARYSRRSTIDSSPDACQCLLLGTLHVVPFRLVRTSRPSPTAKVAAGEKITRTGSQPLRYVLDFNHEGSGDKHPRLSTPRRITEDVVRSRCRNGHPQPSPIREEDQKASRSANRPAHPHPDTDGEPPVCYNRSRATRRSATRMNTQLSTAACVVLSPTPTAPLPV